MVGRKIHHEWWYMNCGNKGCSSKCAPFPLRGKGYSEILDSVLYFTTVGNLNFREIQSAKILNILYYDRSSQSSQPKNMEKIKIWADSFFTRVGNVNQSIFYHYWKFQPW